MKSLPVFLGHCTLQQQENFRMIWGFMNYLAPLALVMTLFISNAYGDGALQLLNQFQSKCPRSVDSFSFEVESLIISFERSIQDLRNDNSCDFIYDELETLALETEALTRYQQNRFYRREILENEEYISLFTGYLNDPSFALYESTLVNSIFERQTAVINASSEFSYYSDLEDKSAALKSANTLNSVLSKFNKSTMCFDSNKNRITDLVGSGLALASYFTSPATAIGLAAGNILTESFNNFFRDRKFVQSLKKLEEARLNEALNCVSEAFTNQYCKSADTLKILELTTEDEESDHEFDGVNLIENHINRDLKTWLRNINAGGEITNSGNFVTKNKPVEQIDFTEKKRRQLQARVGQRRNDIERAFNSGNPEIYIPVFAAAIDNYASLIVQNCQFGGCSSNGIANPFEEKAGLDGGIYKFQIINPKQLETPTCPGSSFGCDIPQYIKSLNENDNPDDDINLDLNFYRICVDRIFNLIDDVLDQLREDKLQVLNKNSYSILNSADLPSQPESMTALDTLYEIKRIGTRVASFLEQQDDNPDISEKDKKTYRNRAKEVRDTTELTNEIILMLDSRGPGAELYITDACLRLDDVKDEYHPQNLALVTSLNTTEKSKKIIDCIIRILNIDSDESNFYFESVENIVKYELDTKKRLGQFSEDAVTLFNLSGTNIVDSILRTYRPGTPKYRIEKNIRSSQKKLLKAYREFYDFYDKEFADVIREADNNEEKMDICFNAISFPQDTRNRVFERRIMKYCEGVVFEGNHGNENRMLWNEYLNKPDSERMCSIYRFDQKELLLDNAL